MFERGQDHFTHYVNSMNFHFKKKAQEDAKLLYRVIKFSFKKISTAGIERFNIEPELGQLVMIELLEKLIKKD